MILVTGATGNFGSKAIEHLLAKGVSASNIAAMVRSKDTIGSLGKQGIEVRIGNYDDVASMVKAFDGIDRLLLVSSSDRGAIENRTRHHINAINAAKKANVKHVVYTSFVRKEGYQNSSIAGFQKSHLETEQHLIASGLNYTILQNGLYHEMVLAFMGEKVAETSNVFFPARDGKASWVLREELAEAAAQVLTSEGHENRTYTLTNTAAIGFEEIAGYLSEAIRKDVRYGAPDVQTFTAILEKSGVPELYINMMVMWGSAIAEGMMNVEDATLERLLGRKPTTLRQFIGQIFG